MRNLMWCVQKFQGETFKKYLPKEILSCEIWQRANALTAFFLTATALHSVLAAAGFARWKRGGINQFIPTPLLIPPCSQLFSAPARAAVMQPARHRSEVFACCAVGGAFRGLIVGTSWTRMQKSSLSPLVHHPFQPIGPLHTPYVFFVYLFVYQFQQSARRSFC